MTDTMRKVREALEDMKTQMRLGQDVEYRDVCEALRLLDEEAARVAALTAERDNLLAENSQLYAIADGHAETAVRCAYLTAERDRLREALEKISAAELWSHGHHVRLDVTTVQEVTVFAKAALAAKGSAGLESMAEPKSAVLRDTHKGNGEGTPPAHLDAKGEPCHAEDCGLTVTGHAKNCDCQAGRGKTEECSACKQALSGPYSGSTGAAHTCHGTGREGE